MRHRDCRIALSGTALFMFVALSTLTRPASITGQTVATGVAHAGAAWTDITPLPGLPTGGYGPAGVITRGYWQRLRATAFYVEDASGRGLALVSTDLFAMPSWLHQSVAKHFTSSNPANISGVALPLERLVIAATHTHQGPGNYLSAEVYNTRGSSKRGFNHELRSFIEAQVIRAIELAIVDARSASETSLDIVKGNVDATLFRNRSPIVFSRNSNRNVILAALGAGIPEDAASCQAARLHGEPEGHWKIDGCPRLRAVDRNVTLLRMRRQGRTHAIALFANVHPTVLKPTTALVSADLFGVTRSQLQELLGAPYPIIGFFNGSEGDVVTRRTTRTATDLFTIGQAFARQIHRIHEQGSPTPVDLTRGIHGRLHYSYPGDAEPSSPSPARLASAAVAGVATLGGAEGDETLFRTFTLWRIRRSVDEHGVKVPALGLFGKLVAPPRTFPQSLPLGVVRMGTFTVVTTPTENSTAAMWQIREALAAPPHGAMEVVSMANEYASYLSTYAEYQEQDYMGASTLWGPYQADFFAAILRRIHSELDGRTGEPAADAPGPRRTFPPGEIGRARELPHDGFGNLLRGGFVEARELPSFEWCELSPVSLSAGERQVEVVAADGSLHDEHGNAVILRGVQRNPDRLKWAAIWLTPLWAERRGVYRFRVMAGSRVIESDQFAVGASPMTSCER